ncbi:MAG TPA: hypothetical protein VFE53_26155 [Mucilaginibacter sp.]|nr:hypothetical protein [Mucilaginibacter sp.]
MKVTLRNTSILFYASIGNILVFGVLFLCLLGGYRGPLINILLAEYCLFFILALICFIRILMFFNEATAIVAAYTMFTGVLVISVIDNIFPRLLHDGYSNWLGILAEVISPLVAFRSFFIKASAVRAPFRFFGAGIGLVTLPRLLVMLIATNFNNELISITGDLGMLVVLLATCFILKRMVDFLRNGVEPPFEAANEQP